MYRIVLVAYRNNSPNNPPYMNGSSSPRNAGNVWQDELNPDQLRAAAVHGTLPTDDMLVRKPTRLDALPLTPVGSASKKKKKKAYNTMDQL